MESRLPKLPTPPRFSPGDDFMLWSFRARPFLESVPTDHFGVFLVSLLDDDALHQVQASGIFLTSRPKVLWSLLEELFGCVQLAPMSLEKFWERKQLQGETVAVLRETAAKAFPNESPADRNSEILKRFSLGLNNDHFKAKFLPKPPLTLAEALTTARSYEALCPILPSLPVNVAVVSSSQARPEPPTPSFGYPGSQSSCQYCRRFGRHAQRCGHNPPVQRVGESLPVKLSLGSLSLNETFCFPPLTVFGLLNGRSVRFLNDTGASCSVMGKTVPTSPDVRQCPAPSLTSADGKPVAVFGRTVATVRLSAFVASHTFVCADIAADVILGMDFLEQYKANIDFVRHVMRLNGCRIQLSQSVSALINDTTWRDAMLTGCNAESKDKQQIISIVAEFRELFDHCSPTMGRTRILQHRIDTGDHHPLAGIRHGNADALSRRPIEVLNAMFQDPMVETEWSTAQRNDPYITFIYRRQAHGCVKPTSREMSGKPVDERILWNAWASLKMVHGVLYTQTDDQLKVVVPKAKVTEVIRMMHQQLGHPGKYRTRSSIS
ncbi:hypothetical protein X801_00082 [Opisthorchis viverrini]|uniref:Peptidase A2 domain-containing protein n=1 Tax=Opisthorchis viverrini TaxID=6198 RepID=A0A1S8XBB2_OPIVI|nr:hypothetical protein X801_00082 [Opisthorchis viverrini]